MTLSKLYLDVPFAEKDQAKSLGARWDAGRKKWYVPAGIDAARFSRWSPKAIEGDPVGAIGSGHDPSASARNPGKPPSDSKGRLIAVTRPKDKEFVAYGGEDPPWS